MEIHSFRYFIEVSYNGTHYAGSQRQLNAKTVESVLVSALRTIFRSSFLVLTGASRTDAGVHAVSNFFHFDWHHSFDIRKVVRSLNGLLPDDIVVKRIILVEDNAHCRFDALSRTYHYHICRSKTPFLHQRAWYCPYEGMDFSLLQKAAQIILDYTDFTAFSKRHTQTKTHDCHIMQSQWLQKENEWIYCIQANRFLRGMVRAIVATMVNVGRGKLSMEAFIQLIEHQKSASADFSSPAYGLYLIEIHYDKNIFIHPMAGDGDIDNQ